ncbi:MAG: serine protease [bacterium]
MIKKVATLSIILAAYLFCLCGLSSAAQLPDNYLPFVKLGFDGFVEEYRQPIISPHGEILDRGPLTRQFRRPFTVGSGSVISADGLILTNYHVYNFEASVEYNVQDTVLYQMVPASTEMQVYILEDNDPLKQPVLRYSAEMLAFDPLRDLCLLRITSDVRTGDEISGKQFHHLEFDNPFAIGFLDELTILGYPTKGGETLTLTEGKFLGYTADAPHALDGSIKTDALIASGNSGGAAMHDARLVGVPTRVSDKESLGADFGYIHPVTWAVAPFAKAKILFDQDTPEIRKEWVLSDYNTDITRSRIFLCGTVQSAQARTPVEDVLVLVYRSDRSFEQIDQLDDELLFWHYIASIKQAHMEGYGKEKLAVGHGIPPDEIQAILDLDPETLHLSNDAKLAMNGEFFFHFQRTDDSGYFSTTAPRGQNVVIFVDKDGYRTLTRNVTAGDGLYDDLGAIEIFAR